MQRPEEAAFKCKVIEEGRGQPRRAVLDNGATILELESAVAAGGHGWRAPGEDKPTMKGKKTDRAGGRGFIKRVSLFPGSGFSGMVPYYIMISSLTRTWQKNPPGVKAERKLRNRLLILPSPLSSLLSP